MGPFRRSIIVIPSVARQLQVAILLALVLFAVPLLAQSQPERPNALVAERAIAQLRSPYCPGVMLEICPSDQVAALRDSIYDLAEAGATTDEIVEWMLANHGEEWRAVPRRSGAGLWAWIIPPLALLLGLGLFVGWLRAGRSAEAAAPPPPTSTLSDAERERIAVAMRDWEASGEEEV